MTPSAGETWQAAATDRSDPAVLSPSGIRCFTVVSLLSSAFRALRATDVVDSQASSAQRAAAEIGGAPQ
jgi:hypothetical protein